MTNKEKILITGGLVLLFILPAMTTFASVLVLTDQIIPQFEGFSSSPYWDYKRYSWGYGTKAPGSTGTITRASAIAAVRIVMGVNYTHLRLRISRHLTVNQWAALLDFAYNEGIGAADKLVPDINSGDDDKLEAHWKQYIYAGGVVNNDLVDRRNYEWNLWTT